MSSSDYDPWDDHYNLEAVFQGFNLPADSDLATIKRTYLNLAYDLHPKLLQTNDPDSFKRFEKLTKLCYAAIVKLVCGSCSNETCRECQANLYVTENFDHVIFKHKGVDAEHHYELLYYDLLEEHARHYRYLPKKKREKDVPCEDDLKLFEFLDYLARITTTDCPICRADKVYRKDTKTTLKESKEESGSTSSCQPCKGSEDVHPNIDNAGENDTCKQKKARSHRSRQKMRRHRTNSSMDQNSESYDDMNENSKEEIDLYSENKEARKKKESQAQAKRKKELESIRNELLKKCKVAEEKEIKKPHIFLPREIIPKSIKKEIERQQKDAERKKRDFERRMREEEAKALKLEKRRRKAEKRKQAVITESMSTTAADSQSMGFDASNEGGEKTSLLERHLEAYRQLMKEQPKRHTTQQLEEERRRFQEAAAQKQQEELSRLRTQNSTQQSQKFPENERQALLEKLREKERQRNMEEIDDCQIKRPKSTDVLQISSVKSISTTQRRAAGRGRGRLHTNLNTNIKIGNKLTDPTFNVDWGSRNIGKCVNFETYKPTLKNVPLVIPDEKDLLPRTHNLPLSHIDCNIPEKNTEVRSSTVSAFIDYKPISYSDCLKKQTVGKNGSDGDKILDTEHVTSHSKPFTATADSKPYMFTSSSKVSMQGNSNQMSINSRWTPRNTLGSETQHFYKEPSAQVDRTFHGGSRETKTVDKDHFDQMSTKKNFWSLNNRERDVLVPALTMDEWVESRKAGSKKKCGSNTSTNTPGSSNTSFSSHNSSSNNSMSLLNVSSSYPGTEESSSSTGEVLKAKIQPSDTLKSDTPKVSKSPDLNGTTRRFEEKSNCPETMYSRNTESDDSLAKMMGQVTIGESQQSLSNSQSHQQNSQFKVQESHSSSCPPLSLSGLQNPNHILNGRSSKENKWPTGAFPSFSFPTGVYHSNDVQQIAMNIQQQQQQIMQMSMNLQTSMMMLASQVATQPAQNSVDLSQSSVTKKSVGLARPPTSSVSSSDLKTVSTVLDTKNSNLGTSDTVTSTIQANQQRSGQVSKSLISNQALSFTQKDRKRQKAKQLSNAEIDTILAKFSDLSFENKPFTPTNVNKYSGGIVKESEKVMATRKDELRSGHQPEEEENWEEGINLESMCLPHSKTKNNNVHSFASQKHILSGVSDRQKDKISHSVIHFPAYKEPELSDKKINIVLNQVPDLISMPNILQPKNSSLSDNVLKKEARSALCRRPLRRPVTAMRCKQNINLPKHDMHLDRADNESRNRYCEPPQRFSEPKQTDTRPSKMLSGQFEEQLNVEIKQSETDKSGNDDGLKTENRNGRSRKKPENPARLMKTALSELTISNRSSSVSPKTMPVRRQHHAPQLNEEGSPATAPNPHNHQATQAKAGLGSHVSETNSLQTKSPLLPLPLSEKLAKPKYFAVPQKSIPVPRKPSAFSLNNVLGTQNPDKIYPPVTASKADSTTTGSKVFSLPTMPLLLTSRLMPKMNSFDTQ